MELQILDLNKSFADKIIFKNFSHSFKDKTTTAVCGSSGCGKTTLLRIISGLDKDFNGKITPEEFTVSVAFQEPRLYPGATVLENIAVADTSERGVSLLNKLGIPNESLSALPFELSGGMARRISLARAILKKADLYLFDEPFSGLDENNALITAQIIKEYCHDKTCIVVTHNQKLAEIFSDDFLYLG